MCTIFLCQLMYHHILLMITYNELGNYNFILNLINIKTVSDDNDWLTFVLSIFLYIDPTQTLIYIKLYLSIHHLSIHPSIGANYHHHKAQWSCLSLSHSHTHSRFGLISSYYIILFYIAQMNIHILVFASILIITTTMIIIITII